MSELNELALTQLELTMHKTGIEEFKRRNHKLNVELSVANEIIDAQTELISHLELYNNELKKQYKDLKTVIDAFLDGAIKPNA